MSNAGHLSPPRRRGFTLVELLVVIGIIAVLISILLPTLGRARESAKRAECLSNMRTIYALMKMYEGQYKGASPLGRAGIELQANYFLTRGGGDPTPRFVAIGQLFGANLIKEGQSGKIFYCPSFQGDINHDFDVPTNPWPPSNPFYDGGSTAAHGCRMSYSQRTILYSERRTDGTYGCVKVHYEHTNPWAGPFLMKHDWPTGPKDTSVAGLPLGPYPKLAKLKNAAIFSDINVGPTRFKAGHKKGINVLFNNGGAKFVDSSARANFGSGFNQTIQQLIDAQVGYGATYDISQIQLWLVLDLQ